MTLFASDFTPLFRLLNDYDGHCSSPSAIPSRPARSIRTFSPRFDVREAKEAYHLDGELPGINQKDIEIEFTDPQTLVIKGQVERQYTTTNTSEAESSDAETPSRSGASTPSHQPTVEDEDEVEGTTKTKQVSKPAQSQAPSQKYWTSERAIGRFHRTFNFHERVDQDGVRAGLRDGILSVVVPKAAVPALKKIRIE